MSEGNTLLSKITGDVGKAAGDATRYVKGLGAAEQVTYGSNQGAVDGCVGSSCGGPGVNIARAGYEEAPVAQGQKGGYYAKPDFDAVHSGGPSGGYIGVTKGTNCGTDSQTNLGASKQHAYEMKGGNLTGGLSSEGTARYGFDEASYDLTADLRGSYAPITPSTVQACPVPAAKAQKGGSRVCHDLRKVKHYRQVRAFWSSICPGAVMMYEKHLAHKIHSHTAAVQGIVKHYTKAFCHEVNALASTNKKTIEKEYREMRKSLAKAGGLVKKVEPRALRLHRMVARRHVNTVKAHHQKHKALTKKHRATARKNGRRSSGTKKHGRKSRKSSKGKKSRKRRSTRSRRRRTMKGGYHQFNSNVPNTPSYAVSTDGGWKMGTPGADMNARGTGCVDNYNHFTGKGFDTPIFDKAN